MTKAELEKQVKTYVETIERMEEELEDLVDENEKLTARIENAPHVEVLELIANPSNWTGNTWTPVLVGTEHPEILADRVLREN